VDKLPTERAFCVAGLVGNQVMVAGKMDEDETFFSAVVSLDVSGILLAPRLPEVPNVFDSRE